MVNLRPDCVLVALVCGVMLVTNLTHSKPVQPTDQLIPISSPNTYQKDSIERIAKDAVAEGGSIVECRNHVCTDLATQEEVGTGLDGYYVVFKNVPGYEEKIQQYQDRVRNWLDKQ